MTRILLLLLLCAGSVSAQTTYPHHKRGDNPMLINVGIESKYFEAQIGTPHCRYCTKSNQNVYLLRGEGSDPCGWEWIPYPNRWPIEDRYVHWVLSNWAIDGNLDGVPDYKQFDYGADGYVNLSDLSFFAEEYGTRWDLSDFSAMGLIYNARRSDD